MRVAEKKFLGAVKLVYRGWKEDLVVEENTCPDEETMACFLEGLLEDEEDEKVKEHLITCQDCMDKFLLSVR